MKKILWILLVSLIFFNINVYADDSCTKDELNRIKSLAELVEIHYEYNFVEIEKDGISSKYPVYRLVATNLNSDLKVEIADTNQIFISTEGNRSVLEGFHEGEKVIINIKAFVPNRCSGKIILTKTIKLPYYNRFSEEDVCQELPDFKYCSEFTDTVIESNVFSLEFNKYIDSLYNDEKVETNSWNLLIIIVAIIGSLFIILLIVTIMKRTSKRSEL